MMTFDRQTAFPGLNALLPTTGAFLIIAAGPTAWLNRIVLASQGMTYIGLISYPLYLWHWPLLAFVRIAESGAPPQWTLAGAVAVGVALAVITHTFIEKPIRRGAIRHIVVTLISACVLLGASGLYVQSSDGLQARAIAQSGNIDVHSLGSERNARIRYPACHLGSAVRTFEEVKRTIDGCTTIATGRRNILVLGDSHGADLWSALAHAYPDVNFIQATGSGCTPIEGMYAGMKNDTCGGLVTYAKRGLAGTHRIDGVVLTARWKENFRDVIADVSYYRNLGLQVIVFGPTFEFTAEAAKIIGRSRTGTHSIEIGPYTTQAVFARDREMKDFFLSRQVPYVSKIDSLCSATSCPVLSDAGKWMIIDDAHWTVHGGYRFGEILARAGALNPLLGNFSAASFGSSVPTR